MSRIDCYIQPQQVYDLRVAVDGSQVALAADEVIGQGPDQDMQIWIEGDLLTMLVEGVQTLQHRFDNAIDDGQIGLASYNARSRFDQVAVMQLHGGVGETGIDDANVGPDASDTAINEMF